MEPSGGDCKKPNDRSWAERQETADHRPRQGIGDRRAAKAQGIDQTYGARPSGLMTPELGAAALVAGVHDRAPRHVTAIAGVADGAPQVVVVGQLIGEDRKAPHLV